jgi:Transglycosylase SLT domain
MPERQDPPKPAEPADLPFLLPGPLFSVTAAQEIPKPKNWQDFQRGCVVLFQAELKDPHALEYGRNGQEQRGIDILGRRNGAPDYFVGIQCRRLAKPMKKAKILADCRAALSIKAGLKEIIFATTYESDVNATTPELLAALAQVESTGNPVARTYWRWQLTWNPFAVYKPASSAVGMYQMTDAAYAEAARYCIRGNAVVDTDCGFTGLYTRAVPSHAIELAAVYLDHDVAAVLARAPDAAASPQQKQDLAAFIHLCGAGSRLGLRAPWFSDDGRRALRRSSRRGISRQGQCDEAAVSAPCCQRPELA